MEPFRSLVIVGDYGSGKTEVAVNLALALAANGERVAIADLDLVNPYFRTREAREPLEKAGVRVVMPRGGHEFADLPILLPEVKGLLQGEEARAILDVGGDAAGSRVLASLAPFARPPEHQLWFVVNARRPFCDTAEGVIAAIGRIEGSSGLRVTGLIANTHLMTETTPEMVEAGARLAVEVGEKLGAPVKLVAAMAPIAAQLPPLGVPVLALGRLMTPPWIRRQVGPLALKLGGL